MNNKFTIKDSLTTPSKLGSNTISSIYINQSPVDWGTMEVQLDPELISGKADLEEVKDVKQVVKSLVNIVYDLTKQVEELKEEIKNLKK